MHSVYALCDPRDGSIRYIGKAIDVHKRYAQHMLYSSPGAKKDWLEELKQLGKVPTLIVLESGLTNQQIGDREAYWVDYYLKQGQNLTNIVKPRRKVEKPAKITIDNGEDAQEEEESSEPQILNGKLAFNSTEAARYLAKKWGIKKYSADAFRILRWRRGLKPDIGLSNASLWYQETLDTIEKPDRSNPRPRK